MLEKIDDQDSFIRGPTFRSESFQKANGFCFRLKIVLFQTKMSADGERNIWRVSNRTLLPGVVRILAARKTESKQKTK